MENEWPEEYAALISDFQEEWQIDDIAIRQEFSNGKTAARVYRVHVRMPNHTGDAVLKLQPEPHLPIGSLASEANQYARAHEDCPAFASAHLPNLIAHCHHAGQSAVLASVAGDSLVYTHPLDRLGLEERSSILSRLSAEILTVWNSDIQLASRASPFDVFGDWVGHRVHQDRGGRVPAFLRENTHGWDEYDSAFVFEHEVLPNPLAYAVNRSLWDELTDGYFAIGRQHADLHGYNILVRSDLDTSEYFIIDLMSYRPHSYLFYDHAYLELNQLLSGLGSSDYRHWYQLVGLMNNGFPLPFDARGGYVEDRGWQELVLAGRMPLNKWLNSHKAQRDDLEGQILLARVAAGLSHVNMRMEVRPRLLAFLYAAVALRRYLKHVGMTWGSQGQVIEFEHMPPKPESDDWRVVWDASDGFSNAYRHILVAGPQLRELDPRLLQNLGRVSWSMVVDLDPESSKGGLLDATEDGFAARRRPVRRMIPSESPNVNYKSSVCWLHLNGITDRPDTTPSDFQTWRRSATHSLRRVGGDLKAQIDPQPVKCLVLPGSMTEAELATILYGLDDVFADAAEYVVVGSPDDDYSTFAQESGALAITCSVTDLLAGLSSMYGEITDLSPIEIPARDHDTGRRIWLAVGDHDLDYLSEDLEIVHSRLVDQVSAAASLGEDFWRGHPISWAELDMQADVQREGHHTHRPRIEELLDSRRTHLVPIHHSPGAGGTTVARRLAWELRTRNPVVIVRRVSDDTADRIAVLVELARLSVFVVLDGVAKEAADRLFIQLRGQNKAAVLLWVTRIATRGSLGVTQFDRAVDGYDSAITPRSSDTWKIVDPMIRSEALDFYRTYSSAVRSTERRAKLETLATDDALTSYRSPFFFGFYAYEREYARVPDFIDASVEGLDERARQILAYLALVSRFSQVWLNNAEILALLGLGRTQRVRPTDLFVSAATRRLILWREGEWRIVHPIIAEELLKKLTIGDTPEQGGNWTRHLLQLSRDFIRSLAGSVSLDSEMALQLLREMFIQRQPRSTGEDGEFGRSQFSELLQMMESHQKALILKELTSCFPDEDHFWHHLGRHYMYDPTRSTYNEAVQCFERAIALESDDPLHHHALGMAYRFMARQRLGRAERARRRQQMEPFDVVFEGAHDLIVRAESCFAECRQRAPENLHGYVTHIQLLDDCIQRLYDISDAESFPQFFAMPNQGSRWALQKLSVIEYLIEDTTRLRRTGVNFGESQRYIDEYSSRVLRYYGDFSAMMDGLWKLLSRDDVNHHSLRRTMIRGYLVHQGRSWRQLSENGPDRRRVMQLLESNLESGHFSSRDVRDWFHLYRLTEEFDVAEAIDRLKLWSISEPEAIDAKYFLYILYTIQALRGLGDGQVAKEYMIECRRLARPLTRNAPYEWLASGPDWCPLLNRDDLDGFQPRGAAAAEATPDPRLRSLVGVITYLDPPEEGLVVFEPGFQAFFAPRGKFRRNSDENRRVRFNLAFSYDGLRAYNPERVDS